MTVTVVELLSVTVPAGGASRSCRPGPRPASKVPSPTLSESVPVCTQCLSDSDSESDPAAAAAAWRPR